MFFFWRRYGATIAFPLNLRNYSVDTVCASPVTVAHVVPDRITEQACKMAD